MFDLIGLKSSSHSFTLRQIKPFIDYSHDESVFLSSPTNYFKECLVKNEKMGLLFFKFISHLTTE